MLALFRCHAVAFGCAEPLERLKLFGRTTPASPAGITPEIEIYCDRVAMRSIGRDTILGVAIGIRGGLACDVTDVPRDPANDTFRKKEPIGTLKSPLTF
jgi:hypothetical protein